MNLKENDKKSTVLGTEQHQRKACVMEIDIMEMDWQTFKYSNIHSLLYRQDISRCHCTVDGDNIQFISSLTDG
jgi:hypothetical protein